MNKTQLAHLVATAALGLTSASALATNGYNSHGYGTVARSMGGAATGVALDAFAGANNPATAAFVGNRLDIGLDIFSPQRSADRTGSQIGNNFAADSKNEFFAIPELGYNVALSKDMAVGVSVYGNGGLNTKYEGGQTNCTAFGGSPTSNPLCGAGKLGVDLMQLVVAPTFAYKLNEQHSVGVSPLLVYQRFKANGLNLFAGTAPMQFSQDPSAVTDRGYDSSTGIGVRLGYFGQLTPEFSVGVAYAPKVNMSEFDSYRGLFAENGDFDIPSSVSAGFGYKVTPTVLIAADFMRIQYSDVAAVNNPSTNQAALGQANGPGFGWTDINVVKIGVQWEMNSTYTLRAGYNRGQNPISGKDVTFNILAPGVVTQHFTFGGSMKLDKASELNLSVMIAPEEEVQGGSLFQGFVPPGVSAGTERVRMNQFSVGLQYSKRF